MSVPPGPGCSILDLPIGGDLLPYVYCNKITLTPYENDAEKTKITLGLEILQNKKELSKNSLLKSTLIGGKNLLDFSFIQVVPFMKKKHINKLMPHHHADETAYPGNVYAAAGHPEADIWIKTKKTSIFPTGKVSTTPGADIGDATPGWDKIFNPLDPAWMETNGDGAKIPDAFQISNSSLLGLLSGGSIQDFEKQSDQKVREEIILGVPYYAISFNYTYITKKNVQNLGFLFFSFLHVGAFMEDFDDSLGTDEASILTGPPSTELVFVGGETMKTKPQFVLPTGHKWKGAAHLHICNLNPDMSNSSKPYCGDGAIGNPNSSVVAGFRGWMAGAQHISGAPKLKLVHVPNYKIQDFRFATQAGLDTMLGLKPDDKIKIFNQKSGVIESNEFLSFFQKENRKYLTKFNSKGSGHEGVSLYDNENEFSKLYINKDQHGRARGFFIIDFNRFLENHSFIYPLLDGADKVSIVQGCLSFSKLLEMKIYRDRVKDNNIGKKYENYSTNEPSYLVATIHPGGTTAEDSNFMGERDLQLSSTEAYSTKGTSFKCFHFVDDNVKDKSAGLYQYRIEMSFKDGTYYFLNSLSTRLSVARRKLQEYYELSLRSHLVGYDNIDLPPEGYSYHEVPNKLSRVPYYKDNKFVSPLFKEAAELYFAPIDRPWIEIGGGGAPFTNNYQSTVPFLIGFIGKQILHVEGWSEKYAWGDALSGVTTLLASMIHPVDGSPQGIEYVIRYADSVINKLQKLIGSTRISKKSDLSDYVSINGYTVNNFFKHVVSSAEATIKEEYTFDHPQELYLASTKDVYIDYLASGPPSTQLVPPPAFGLHEISVAGYKDRCNLDVKRLVDEEAWAEATDKQKYYFGKSGVIARALGETKHSYLMPSIIEVSAPGQGTTLAFEFSGVAQITEESYKFLWYAFNNGDPTNFDYDAYDYIMSVFSSYNSNKEEVKDADLLDKYYKTWDGSKWQLLPREVYKNLFSSAGMMVYHHSETPGAATLGSGYEKLFGPASWPAFKKQGGADWPGNSFVPEGPGYTEPADFNLLPDKDIPSQFYYKAFFNNNLFNIPAGDALRNAGVAANSNLPNIFKISSFLKATQYVEDVIASNNAAKIASIPANTKPLPVKQIFGHPLSKEITNYGTLIDPTYESFLYIHANLLSEIQRYTGPTLTGVPTAGTLFGDSYHPLKSDEGSWKKLNTSDLENIGNGSYLCRIVLYNESAAQGVKLPIINKYFLLTGEYLAPPPAEVAISSINSTPTLTQGLGGLGNYYD